MAEWVIPVSWAMQAKVHVQADSLEEAKKLVEAMDLPEDGEYMEDSFQIDLDDDELLGMQEDKSIDKSSMLQNSWDELVALTLLKVGNIYTEEHMAVISITINLLDPCDTENSLVVLVNDTGKHYLAILNKEQTAALGGRGHNVLHLIRDNNEVRIKSKRNDACVTICMGEANNDN